MAGRSRPASAGLSEKLVPSSPQVMLSPNATNRVTESFGTTAGGLTTMAKEHASERDFASETVQVTVVVPTVNFDPLAAVHDGPVSGVAPPVTLGAPNTTVAPEASGACTGCGAGGNEIFGQPGSTGVGCDGQLLHTLERAAIAITAPARACAPKA